MRSQDSVVSDDSMSWSIISTAPYMDMLKTVRLYPSRHCQFLCSRDVLHQGMFGPLRVRPDGTHVFAIPLGKGHVPLIALSDLGFFARYIFDNGEATSAQELEVASDVVSWDELVATFTKVTGKKAEYVALSNEEWFALFEQEDIARPFAPDTTASFKETFTRFWRAYHDDIITRDLEWIRRVHPGVHTVESWMRANAYTGEIGHDVLKNAQDGKGPRPNLERIAQL